VRKLILVALATALSASVASAAMMTGLGFRSLSNGPATPLANSPFAISATPAIGIRSWLNERYGIDISAGFATIKTEVGDPSVDLDSGTGYVFDIGVPISAKKWDKVNVLFRPGFTWGQATAKDKTTPTAPNELKTKVMSLTGEIEVEYMLVDKLSISAAHGVAWRELKLEDNASPAGQLGKATGFETTGENFTTLGFHVYLWGAGQ
jgi:hypothetical protein